MSQTTLCRSVGGKEGGGCTFEGGVLAGHYGMYVSENNSRVLHTSSVALLGHYNASFRSPVALLTSSMALLRSSIPALRSSVGLQKFHLGFVELHLPVE